MNIPEAIEILTKEKKDHHSFPTDLIGKAEELGIEALKLLNDTRLTDNGKPIYLLPGETEN